MVDHDLLHMELARLASAASDYPDLNEALHQLSITAAVGLGVDGAGVTLSMPTGATEFLAASDDLTLRVERRQDELKQGACVDAVNSSEIVAVGDLTTEARWPDYRPFVLGAGFQALAGIPVSFRGDNIGAVNLYSVPSRAWTTDEFAAARMIAALAAGYLVNSHLLTTTQTLAGQLQHALDSRIIIEQAKGVLAGRTGMAPDAGFEFLRAYARSNRIKLHDVARGVVNGTIDVTGGTAARRSQGQVATS